MNDLSGLDRMAPDRAAWSHLFDEVNAWRGQCLHHLSSVERALTEALLFLAPLAPPDKPVRLRHLIGQRFEDMAAAVAEDGPFAAKGGPVRQALAKYRAEQESFRALLCHGQIRTALYPNGKWVLLIELVTIRTGKEHRCIEVVEQSDTADLLDVLKRDGTRLTSLLGALRRSVMAAPVEAPAQ